jgi:FKBP-type peptidyl-prolyl cis-trans isomerase
VLKGDGTEEIFFVFRGYQKGYGQSQKILIDQAPNGHPAKMPFGRNSLLDGMENGMLGMCVGEQRRLWIPPHFAYAAPKFDNDPKISHIARDRDVEYEVELVHIQR